MVKQYIVIHCLWIYRIKYQLRMLPICLYDLIQNAQINTVTIHNDLIKKCKINVYILILITIVIIITSGHKQGIDHP